MSDHILRTEFSDDWQAALTKRGTNGFHKHVFVGDFPRAGYWRVRLTKDGPLVPIHIVELAPVEEETGALIGDVTHEAITKTGPVAVADVWPWCGKMPISRKEFEEMMGATAAQPEATPGPVAVAIPMQSDQINELAAALAKAQGQITGASKDASNPAFKQGARVAAYATLASVWDACRQALSSNGLSVTQTTRGGETPLVTVITTLWHSSGQWLRSELALRPVKADPQGIGSALTYARRYALAAMVGVAPEDDDGEGAMGRQTKPEENPRHNEAVAAANTWANEFANAIDRCKTERELVDLMETPANVTGCDRLKANYPKAWEIVNRAYERKSAKVTPLAAAE